MEPRLVLLTLLGVTLAIGVVADLRLKRIPDWVTFPAIALALAVRFGLEGLGDFDSGLVAGAVGALVELVIFAGFAMTSKGLGWGDVKLLVAVGALLGAKDGFAAALLTSIAGAVEGVAISIWKRRSSARLGRLAPPPPHATGAGPLRIPYGVAIAVGSVWAVWWELSAS